MRSLYTTPRAASGLALPLALVYCGLVVYASLYPFVGWQSQGVMPWAFVTAPLPKHWSGFDVAINVLGYVPLGFLWMLAFMPRIAARPLIWTLVLASLLSFTMEALQTYLTPRVSSNADWVLNAVGAWVGASFAWSMEALGLMRIWQRFREGRFDAGSGFVLGLLLLWPLALLYPTPVPLGLGHGPGFSLGQWLELDAQELPERLETVVVMLGLLIPLLLAFAITPKWGHRLLSLLLITLSSFGVMSLSNTLSFGPQHLTVWLQSHVQLGLLLGLVVGTVLLVASQRLCWLLTFVCLVPYLTLQSTVSVDPYMAQTLALWEQGQFIRFYGATQWLGWLWPYAVLVLVITRLTHLTQPNKT
jgi:VanZ family protein